MYIFRNLVRLCRRKAVNIGKFFKKCGSCLLYTSKHEPDVTVRERQTFKEKKYIIDGLDCAQCAEEVREAVEKSD